MSQDDPNPPCAVGCLSFPLCSLQTYEFAVRADEALIGWVAKQHTHFAELLSPQAAAAAVALLEGRAAAGSTLSLSERKELLQVLRQLAAVVQPDRSGTAV